MSRVLAPVLATASLAAVAALTACSSSGSGTGGTPTSTAPAGTATVTSPSSMASTSAASAPADGGSSSSTDAGSGSSSAPAAYRSGAPCAEAQLRASVTPVDLSSIGRHALKLVFANTSDTTCTLTGYPGAAIEDSSNKQVQQAKRTVGGPVGGTIEKVATISVAPGKSVFAYLEGQSTREQGAAQAGCDGPKYPRILVTPPNTSTPVPFSTGWPLCYAFNVHPVRSQ